MSTLRTMIGFGSLCWGGLWYIINQWSRGMRAFGSGSSSQASWISFAEYFPLLTFALILISVLLMRRWLFHLVALLAAPAFLLSAYLALHNPFIGLPLNGYLALWFYLYYCFVWHRPKLVIPPLPK